MENKNLEAMIQAGHNLAVDVLKLKEQYPDSKLAHAAYLGIKNFVNNLTSFSNVQEPRKGK